MKAHGIMFHHFHNDRHIKGQGSISNEQLEKMIEYIGRKNILSADEWYERAVNNKLKETDLCITLDDGLKCQFDVAYPVFKYYGITAFWFVYSSPFQGELEWLEVYRYFRFSNFEDIDDFYNEFFSYLKLTDYKHEILKEMENFIPSQHLSDFPFYTDNDRTFRYIRDEVLGPERYHHVMKLMLRDYKVDLLNLKDGL
ncbi:hypothetical protein J7E78_00325 [Paenibacillus polymyxa]|uniref:hypothetical protein n=1 Tax=Paenibacillus polymyxa TaxID=1406 RepID=UPI001BE7AC02|nr:hypothetical protein [Paenibacillus polymyxa]MBT2282005.1 hypothetical protein [Paenibacillus polymyxa]